MQAWLRTRPPPQALAWVRDVLRAGRVSSVRPLHGGRSHANHAVTVADDRGGRRTVVLRRWARPGWELTDPDFTVAREVTALTLLAEADAATPRVIATDSDGSICGTPALVLTRLPGRAPSGPPPTMFAEQLARAIRTIHELDVARSALPGYRPYNDLTVRLPPAGSLRPRLWLEAMDIAAVPPPVRQESVLHRDYHPGNTLWARGRLTGIVDWTSASQGPVGVDLGHMRWNLAVAHGRAAADGFLRAYARLAPAGFAHDPYWDVRTVVDLLRHDPGWPLSGPDLDRLEAHLDLAVRALTGRPPDRGRVVGDR